MDKYNRKRTEITIETTRVTTVKMRTATSKTGFCRNCGQSVVSPDNKAAESAGDSAAIIELYCDGQEHRPSPAESVN